MHKILLAGYFGFKNAGDEAILEAVVKQIKEKLIDADISVLTNDKEHTQKYHEIKCVDRMNISALIKSVFKTDVIVFAGGSLFQDVTSFKSIIYYSGLCFLAGIFNKRYILAFQGLGPINRKLSKKLLRSVLKHAWFVSLRDHDSYVFAKSIFERVYTISSDPVFIFHKEMKDKSRVNEKTKKIVFILKDQKDHKKITKLIDVAKKLKLSDNVEIYHLILYPDQDKDISTKFSRQTGSIELKYNSTEDIIGKLTEAFLVFAMRYHGIVFSLCANTPCITISYDPKMDALSKEQKLINFEDIVDIPNQPKISCTSVGEAVNRAITGFYELIKAIG